MYLYIHIKPSIFKNIFSKIKKKIVNIFSIFKNILLKINNLIYALNYQNPKD